MKSDFLIAVTQLAAERNLPQDMVISAVEAALASAYRRENASGGQSNIRVHLDPGHRRRRGLPGQDGRRRDHERPRRTDGGRGQPYPQGHEARSRRRARVRDGAAGGGAHRRADREASRHPASARGRARAHLRRVHRPRGRGVHGDRPAGRLPLWRRGNTRPQRPGDRSVAAVGAASARALPPRHEDESNDPRGCQDPARARDRRHEDPPQPPPAAVRDGGAGDLQRHRRDSRHRARARIAQQSRRLCKAGRRRPGRRVRRAAGHPHPEHRQRAPGREDRRHPVVAGPGRLHLPCVEPGPAVARRAQRAGRNGDRRRA